MPEPNPNKQVVLLPIIVCRTCAAVIGVLISSDGKTLLQTGALLLTQAHGYCSHCNTEYRWKQTAKSPETINDRNNPTQTVV